MSKTDEMAVGKEFTYDEGQLFESLKRIQHLEAITAKNSYEAGYQAGYADAKQGNNNLYEKNS